MKQLSDERITKMRQVRDTLVTTYGKRDSLLKRYDEIFFMSRGESPKYLNGTDENDVKETISSSGRDAVVGLARILKSAKVHVKVKNAEASDKIEAGLKTMLRVSGEVNPLARVEDDTFLSTVLYGPGVMTCESVDDLIETQKNPMDSDLPKYKNEYVAAQLELIRRKTPFLFHAVSPKQSYPLFGAYGMVGHVRKYVLKGSEITDRWGVVCNPNDNFNITDFFYYTDRLVEAEGISEPLMAEEWVSRDSKGNMIGSINIPVFTRFAGGSSLWHEPEKQSQPLLYGKAAGNWDLRENLLWTYLFTAIYQQGIPGPLLLIDPENAGEDIVVDYSDGIRKIIAKGQLQDPQIIDGDVLRLKDLLDGQAATQTIQPQTLGQNTPGITFSQFALASKAGLIPAVDPKAALEALYKDVFIHVLQRIKQENIENDLIAPADIPDSIDMEVSIEPDLEQDDLRNAQIAVQIRNAGIASREWIETNILKIADSNEMFRQRKKEELMDAAVELLKSPEMLAKYIPMMMGEKKPTPGQQTPPEQPSLPGQPSGGEQLPQTDAMIPQEERM